MTKRRENKYKLREKIFYIVFSFGFSMATFFSIKMPTEFKKISWLGMSFADLLLIVEIFCVSLLSVIFLNKVLDRINGRYEVVEHAMKIQVGYIFIITFIAWLPFFLAFYPGNLSSDSYSSIEQALGHITSTAHPVLFTLLVRIT